MLNGREEVSGADEEVTDELQSAPWLEAQWSDIVTVPLEDAPVGSEFAVKD
jgi:hypothetical protein